jgi:hypothetical protein
VHDQLSQQIFEPDEERSKVITLHLFVEYWIDRILEKRSMAFPETFHKKVKALNDAGVFTESLFGNLTIINKLRNIYAHEIDLSKAHARVSVLIADLILDPYFASTDRDHFRSVCIQTMFLLESTFDNNGEQPIAKFPKDETREKLNRDGRLHWQECELLSNDRLSQFVHRYVMRCPFCASGTIIREKDSTPGFRESNMTACGKCGLTGDGSYLLLETARS